jgi:hypothetical protein
MDSQPGIGGGPNKRITRSWYPGGQACTNRTTKLEAATPCSSGTSGLGADVGYWGRVNTQGEFEEDSGFPEPSHASRFPWRSLFVAIRRILPLSAAALVGAVTALAWQSFVFRPAQPPAGRPTLPVPAAQAAAPARTSTATERPPADPPPVRESAPALAVPARARPAPQMLLGRPRTPSAKVNPVRVTRPVVAPAHRGPSGDPDAILAPTFL